MNHPELSILIPAAGESARLGRAKQLLEYGGKPLILNTVNTANSLGPGEILVVTGANAKLVEKAVSQPPVHWVYNPNWSDGIGVSIATGAAEIRPESTGVMILLCDQWRIGGRDLQALAKTWQSNPNRIVCAQAEGINMPPVIFPSACFTHLRKLNGNQGARNLLKTHAEMLTPLNMPNAAFDLDTPAQLSKLP